MSKNNSTIPCVAFFTLKDFIDEARRESPWLPPVRVEGVTESIPNGNVSPLVRYEVWVTSFVNGQVLAARFLVGSDLEIFSNHHHLRRNHEKAQAIIRARLEVLGFDVRPGIWLHDIGNVQANGAGLWLFNGDHELDEEPVENA